MVRGIASDYHGDAPRRLDLPRLPGERLRVKSQCYRCGEGKPGGGGGGGGGGYGGGGYGGGGDRPPPNVRPGDWTCPSCNANVFASKMECFRCQAPKPAGAGGGRFGGGGGGSYGGFGGAHPSDGEIAARDRYNPDRLYKRTDDDEAERRRRRERYQKDDSDDDEIFKRLRKGGAAAAGGGDDKEKASPKRDDDRRRDRSPVDDDKDDDRERD